MRFMLLAYDDPADFADMDEAAMAALIERYVAWTEELERSGRLLASDKLKDHGGHRITRRHGRLELRDGPFAEAKEVLGGYWLIEVADEAEALRIAQQCPHVEYGVVELREIE